MSVEGVTFRRHGYSTVWVCLVWDCWEVRTVSMSCVCVSVCVSAAFSLEQSGISFADLFRLVAFYCISRYRMMSDPLLPPCPWLCLFVADIGMSVGHFHDIPPLSFTLALHFLTLSSFCSLSRSTFSDSLLSLLLSPSVSLSPLSHTLSVSTRSLFFPSHLLSISFCKHTSQDHSSAVTH